MEQEATKQQKKDDTLIGLLVVGAILLGVIGFVYLLSVQQKSGECETQYNPDGTVRVGCSPIDSLVSPSPAGSVELLDQLNKNSVSEVDKKLQEAAQDLQRRQNQRIQQQQPQVPQIPR